MSITVKKGATDVTTYFMLVDSSAFTPESDYTVTDLDLTYVRDRAAAVKNDATALTTISDAHADNKAYQVSKTTALGLYRVDWPDAAFSDNSAIDRVQLMVTGTGLHPSVLECLLEKYDVSDVYEIVSDVHSDTTIIASDVVLVYSDTTAIATEITQVHSETTAIQSDAAAVESELIVVHSETTVIQSDAALIEADHDKTQSDIADLSSKIDSDALLVQSDLSDIKSELVVVHSETTATQTSAAGAYSDTALIYSDTTAIEAAGGGLTAAQASDLAAIESELILVHSETTVIASDLVVIDAAMSEVVSDAAALLTAVSDVSAKIDSDALLVQSDISDIKSELVAVHSETTDIQTTVGNIYSDTATISDISAGGSDWSAGEKATILSDLVAIETATGTTLPAKLDSDATIIVSDVAAVYSDTAAIHTDTGAISDLSSKLDSDALLVQSDLSDIKSELVVVHSETTATHGVATNIYSDTSYMEGYSATVDLIYSDLTKTALSDLATASAVSNLSAKVDSDALLADADHDKTQSDVALLSAKVDSDALIVQSELSDIKSELVIVHSETTATQTSAAGAYSDTTLIYSDTTAIETAAGTTIPTKIDSDALLYLADHDKTQSDIADLSSKVDSDALLVYTAAKADSDMAVLAAQADSDAVVISDAIATAQADLDTLTGVDGVTLATLQPNYAPSTHDAAAVRTEMDANSTKLAAIVADTNELQTDWGNGGRLDTLLDTAAASNSGSGARTVAITVTDGTDPVESSTVRVTKGAETYTQTTDVNGLATFNLDDGSWVVAITRSNYSYGGTTLTVDGDETVTYAMTAQSITASTPGKTTLYADVYEETGALAAAGVSVYLEMIATPGSTGHVYSGTTRTGTTDANGRVEFTNCIQGAQYAIWASSNTSKFPKQIVTINVAATQAASDVLGAY
jgi:hypothetical protein